MKIKKIRHSRHPGSLVNNMLKTVKKMFTITLVAPRGNGS